MLYSPGHSFILDTNYDMWNDVFTEEEKKEIEEKADEEEFEVDLPEDIINCLSNLNGKVWIASLKFWMNVIYFRIDLLIAIF